MKKNYDKNDWVNLFYSLC